MNRIAGMKIEKTYTGHPKSMMFNYKQSDKFGIENNIELSRIPNEETLAAIQEAKQNKTKGFNSIEELLYDLKH